MDYHEHLRQTNDKDRQIELLKEEVKHLRSVISDKNAETRHCWDLIKELTKKYEPEKYEYERQMGYGEVVFDPYGVFGSVPIR